VKREANRVMSLKTLVAQGRYQVDPHLVAEALVARLFGGPSVGWPLLQSECSKPSSSASESKKHTSD
jgi:hypothetical protein